VAQQHQRSSVVGFTLVIVLLVLATIVVVVAAVFVVSEQFPSAAGPRLSPLSAIKAGAINPALALDSLAGVHDQSVAERAIASGSIETAFATLLYSTSLNDQMRAAGLLTLANRLTQDGKKDQALLAARTAVDVAILSPMMPDYNRAAALAQAGQVLRSLGKTDEATYAYDTAAIITEHSGRIDPSYRQVLLEGLAEDVSRAGHKEQARQLRAAANAEPPTLDATPYVLPALLIPLVRGESADWAELDAATTERVSLASALVAALEGNSPTPSETVRQSLEKALLAEDRLREQVYSQGLAESDNLLQRVAYARVHMEWLTLKWRVARQGFGMALVPAWENQVGAIEASLHKACDDYYVILRDVAASLPDQIEAVQGAIDVIQDEIKLGRLGLPPYAQEGELVRALDKANRERMDLGLGSLYVTMKTEKNSSQLTVIGSQ